MQPATTARHAPPTPRLHHGWASTRVWLALGLLLLVGCATQPPAPPLPQAQPDAPAELAQRIGRAHGPAAEARVRRWLEIIAHGQSIDDLERLELANQFFNEARFTTDLEIWGREDYWATPVEFLIKDAGDCEEFAIAKYFTLAEMGVADTALRITYVKALMLDQPHMVLAWYASPAADPLILDNLDRRILPASERPDLLPVYSFNGTDLWLARNRREQVHSGDATSLSHWQQLRHRLARQLAGP